MNGCGFDHLSVRKAGPGDLETIVEFNAAMALETEGRTLDLATLRAGVLSVLTDESRGFYLIAGSADRAAGQLMVTTEWSDWRNAWFWWIQSVFVHRDFRRQGIYRALDQRVRELARSQGDVCGIRLYVDRDNLPAQQVYERLGMERARYYLMELEFDRR